LQRGQLKGSRETKLDKQLDKVFPAARSDVLPVGIRSRFRAVPQPGDDHTAEFPPLTRPFAFADDLLGSG